MKWLYGLLCLFFLVLFHEIGHFVAAKIFGVKVESFSIGIGPVLIHKKIKNTDWRFSLLPLGGYCGMKGEQEFRKAIEEDKEYINAEPDSLYGVHPIKRALIGFAGPFFNFVFAIIAFSIVSGIGYSYYTYSSKIIISDEIYEDMHSAAKDYGLQTGDIITHINNIEINYFSDIVDQISTRPDEDVKIKVLRNNLPLEFVVHTDMDKESGTGKLGVAADTNTKIEKYEGASNFFDALKNGMLETFNSIKLTFKGFKILFKGVKITSAVSGPARVTDMLGSTVQDGFKAGIKIGFIAVLNLMGIISISLCIMNLLPVPILDGGLILIAFIELIFKHKVKPKTQYRIQFIGLGFIVILLIIGLAGDISYFIHK